MTQTLAHGSTVTSKYGALGLPQKPATDTSALGSTLMLVVGFGGKGKSFLFSNNPNAFVFNFDTSPCVNSQASASVWPHNVHGRTVDEQGRPFIITWEAVLAKLDILRRMAEDNFEGRPHTVVIDTLDSMLYLIRPFLVKKRGKSEWKELGMEGWGMLNDTAGAVIRDLRRWGYGVAVLSHLEITMTGEQRSIPMTDTSCTQSCLNQFIANCDIVARIESEPVTRTVKVKVPYTVGTEQKFREEDRVEASTRHLFLTYDPQMPYFCKIRTLRPFPPRLEIPKDNAWEFLSKQYADANTPQQ